MSEDWTRRYENGRVDTELRNVCVLATSVRPENGRKPENTKKIHCKNMVCMLDINGENYNLELAEKLGKNRVFGSK